MQFLEPRVLMKDGNALYSEGLIDGRYIAHKAMRDEARCTPMLQSMMNDR